MDSIRNFFKNMKERLAAAFGGRKRDYRSHSRSAPARPGLRTARSRRDLYMSRARYGGARQAEARLREAAGTRERPGQDAAGVRERQEDWAAPEEPRERMPQPYMDEEKPAQHEPEGGARDNEGAGGGAVNPFYTPGVNLWGGARSGAQGERDDPRAADGPKVPYKEEDMGETRFPPERQAMRLAKDEEGETRGGGGESRAAQGGGERPGQEYAVDKLKSRWATRVFPRSAQQSAPPAGHAGGETQEFRKFGEGYRSDFGTGKEKGPKGLKALFQTREKPPNALLGVAFTSFQLLIYALLVLGIAGIGAVVGIAKAYTDTAPVLDVGKIQNQDLTSFIYDGNGNLITTFAGAENRVWATIDEIPVDLQHAIVAIEDSRFYTHNGVDVKRIVGAFFSNVGSDATQGGSTITQQLIKNTLGSSERTYKRKIQEAWLSMQLEAQYKSEYPDNYKGMILEAYLNTIPLGESDYGVKTAAQDYFGKSLDQLTLRECAMLAGLTQSPYLYDPRLNMYTRNRMDITDKRTNTVLMCMYEQGFIDKAQYESALNETVSIRQTSSRTQMYDMPYFIEYALEDIKTHLLKARGLEDTPENRGKIDTELRTGGYKIYLTVDPDIQKTVEDTLYNWDKYPKMQYSKDTTQTVSNGANGFTQIQQPQAAAVVLDYHTGELKAVVGGRQQPTSKRTLNRAYQSRMPVGSCIKPIAVYGPAIDMGMSPASIIYNIPAPVAGWKDKNGVDIYPKNYSGDPFTGATPMRQGLIHSYNVVAARLLMDDVGLDKAYDTLMKLGIKQTSSNNIKKDGPGLALGTSGITPVEMTAAYGALGNKGEYIEPLSFSKIVDSKGNTVLDAEQVRVKTQVFKASTAWMMIDMMKDVITKGTGTKAKLSGMTVAGKTGTNSDYRGVSFCALTPYYSAEVWVGSDAYAPLYKGATGGKDAAPLWKAFMQKIHTDKGLKNKEIISDTAASLGIEKATVCGVSGLLVTEDCQKDTLYPPVTDWFLKGTVPTEPCNMHYPMSVCQFSGKLATPFCPQDQVEQSSVLIVPQDSVIRLMTPEDVQKYFPTALLDFPGVDDLSQFTWDNPLYAQYFCPFHTQDWANVQGDYNTLVEQANALVGDVRQNMEHYWWLSQGVVDALNGRIDTVLGYIQKGFSDPAETPQTVYDHLLAAVNDLRSYSNLVLVPTPEPTATWTPEPTATPAAETPPGP
jgi:penicillin-binding protein 1A